MITNADISGLLEQFEEINSVAISTYEAIKMWSGIYLFERYKGEITAVVDGYNDAVDSFNQLKNKINSEIILKIPNIDKSYETQNTKKGLLEIVFNCKKAIGILKRTEIPLSLIEIRTLDSLREEIGKMQDKIKDMNYYRNIEESIKEYENGHYLASSLISSRVIDSLLSKIAGSNIKEKIETLIRGGSFEEKRRDIKESLIKSSKLSRNFMSHDIAIFPAPPESLSLLADSINILKIFSKTS